MKNVFHKCFVDAKTNKTQLLKKCTHNTYTHTFDDPNAQ